MNKLLAEIRLVLGTVILISLCSAFIIKKDAPKMGMIDNGLYKNPKLGLEIKVNNNFNLLFGEQLKAFEQLAWNEFPITTSGEGQNDLIAVLASSNVNVIRDQQEILIFSEKVKNSLIIRNSWDYLHQWQTYYEENSEAYLVDEYLGEKILAKRIFNILDVSLFLDGEPVKCRIYSTLIDDVAYTLVIKSPGMASDEVAEDTLKSLKFI